MTETCNISNQNNRNCKTTLKRLARPQARSNNNSNNNITLPVIPPLPLLPKHKWLRSRVLTEEVFEKHPQSSVPHRYGKILSRPSAWRGRGENVGTQRPTSGRVTLPQQASVQVVTLLPFLSQNGWTIILLHHNTQRDSWCKNSCMR